MLLSRLPLVLALSSTSILPVALFQLFFVSFSKEDGEPLRSLLHGEPITFTQSYCTRRFFSTSFLLLRSWALSRSAANREGFASQVEEVLAGKTALSRSSEGSAKMRPRSV